MYLQTKNINCVRGLKQRWGTKLIRRAVWNNDFVTGRWDCLENTAQDVIYHYLVKHCRNGSLLDLGCGSGNTGCELDESAYRDYTGVDISDVAIEMARKRCARSGRIGKNRYHWGDITTYVPDKTYDVILFRESIPYIRKRKVKGQLERYSYYLKDNGVFIIRWFDQVGGY